MLSLILPYWDRQEAADRAFKTLEIYSGLDMEIIVVDDGNKVRLKVPETSLRIKVVHLPGKDEPKSPVTPWNIGVKYAEGEVVVISCIEMLHEKPILEEMLKELESIGPEGYVLASAWCPESGTWHCHNSVRVPTCPKGTGLSFCGMMYRDFYMKVGGFDEIYRDGAGYEDRDFIWKMTKAGAKFLIRDDLKVIHPKSDATIKWGQDKFYRNEAIYKQKWNIKQMVFCCINAGNYLGRGVEYVNILHDMVRRNLPDGYEGKFVVFTDGVEKYDAGIEVRQLPGDLSGWDNKIWLFKKGVFKSDERVVYFDLDTLIVGPLEDIFSYDGKFATLKDFWHPNELGPAVMMWEGGYGEEIWEEYILAGKPSLKFGDKDWLQNHFMAHMDAPYPHRIGWTPTYPDLLQDLYPESFVSFKTHCEHGIPKGASVICFHGLPRPHEVNGWVQEVWKKNGISRIEVNLECNVNDTILLNNIRHSSSLGYGWIINAKPNEHVGIICGSGPSLIDTIPVLQRMEGRIFALNNACRVLNKHGIIPQYQVILDARKENVSLIGEATTYLIGSQAHPALFEALKGKNIYLWHPLIEGIDAILEGHEYTLIGGGTTVGMSAMCLAYTMGYRNIHLFGYDSCHRNGIGHAELQEMNKNDPVLDVLVGDRLFKCSLTMARQAEIFQHLSNELAELDCEINVHGSGLIPYIAQLMTSTT